jgi:redox-sensitive bicupin YhaK (pirin superfamily)
MAVLAEGIDVEVRARGPVTLMLIGGTALGPRVVWWNFVASSRERIESAKIEWARYGDSAARGRFASIEGETEFIPLPAR